MPIKNALKELLDNLDKVEARYPEVLDTAVRDVLHGVIFNYFVYGKPDSDYPSDDGFAMYTRKGDKAVYKAIVKFLTHPDVRAARTELKTPEERFEAFQDNDVQSSNGNRYDWYFGWLPDLSQYRK